MWIVRKPEYTNAIVSSPWQRIQPQLEKLTTAYPQFQSYLKHQPVAQPSMWREDFRKAQYALRIVPRANAVADRSNLRLFQGAQCGPLRVLRPVANERSAQSCSVPERVARDRETCGRR